MTCDPNGMKPKNLVASTRAAGQIQGDIFSEAERVKGFSGEQRYYYEKVMANLGLRANGPKGNSAWDAIKKEKSGAKSVLTDGMNYDAPSKIFSKKFYGAIDKRMETFQNGKDHSPETYNQLVGQPANNLLKTIRSEIADAKTTRELNSRLRKFGLDSKTVYNGTKYLEWIGKGAHTQTPNNPFAKLALKAAGNSAKAQAALNLLWTAGNGVDMIRVTSHYLTRKPTSVVNVTKGVINAIKATKGQPWRRVPELERAGVYSSTYVDRGGSNLSPFEMSITAQKNLVYHLDKAAGGNGTDGIRDLLFDSKPWDRPLWDQHGPMGTLVLGLARYPINESRWLMKTGAAAAKGDLREQANLLTYGLLRAFFVGSASNIPSWLLNKDGKEWFEGLDKTLHLNQVKEVSREIFRTIGFEGELNLGDYVSPLSINLGSRAQSVSATATQVGRHAGRGAVDLAQGNLPAAAARGAGAVSAMMNITGWGKSVKLLSGGNSTQVTGLLDTLARNMENEFGSPDQFKREAAKDFFGSGIKKPDKNDGLPDLPDLPKLPSMK